VYDYKWNTFAAWANNTGINPRKASVPEIAEFFIYLFQEKKLAPKTIEGYRSSISSALKTSGMDVGKDWRLTSLVQSFLQERPPSSKTVPGWDLSLVLMALTREPFEPLAQTPLNLLTWKVAFLLLLATGSRRGEVHAMSYARFEHHHHWKSVTLQVIPSFIAKTQLRTSGGAALKPISIPALTSLGPDMKEDRSLCPVRAIKIYLARTQHFRKGKLLLLMSVQRGRTGDIHKNTLSSWIRSLIRMVYQTAPADAIAMSNTKTHEIRAQAASLAFRGGIELEELLKAGTWKSQSTFLDFYMKDVSVTVDGLQRLGPVIAAQRVISG